MSLDKKEATTPEKQPTDSDVYWGWAFLAGVILAFYGSWIYAYRSSSEVITFTVDRRERVTQSSGDSTKSYYLVWSREGEVFQVTDDWAFLTWDSSDRYGRLKEGSTVTAKVAGWRVPFFSWYRNLVEVQLVK